MRTNGKTEDVSVVSFDWVIATSRDGLYEIDASENAQYSFNTMEVASIVDNGKINVTLWNNDNYSAESGFNKRPVCYTQDFVTDGVILKDLKNYGAPNVKREKFSLAHIKLPHKQPKITCEDVRMMKVNEGALTSSFAMITTLVVLVATIF